MLVEKELIIKAKKSFGDRAVQIISEDLQLERFDEKNQKASCPFGHSDSDPSFIWNDKDACFHCFSCGKNYGILDHYIDYCNLTFLGAVEKLFDETGIKYSFGERGVKTQRSYVYPSYDKFHNREQVEQYCEIRKISKDTLDYCDVQESQDGHGNIVFHFYDENDVLTLVKYRPARKVAKGENKNWSQVGADTRPILFNMNRIDPTKTLLITEGETDTLSAVEAGFKNAVSVPFCAQNFKWIEENFDWLEQFDKIIIWSDNDEPGIKMRREVCARLGVWRTFYVDLPPMLEDDDGEQRAVKDINEVLYIFGKQKVIDFIENAQEMPIEGIEDMANIEDFDLEKAEGLPPGLKAINDIIYKFLFKSVLLVTGVKGHGKSTLVNQLFVCNALQQGHDVFMFSGELGGPVLKSWIELTMAGPEKVAMKDDFVHIIDSEARKEMRDWYKNRIWVYNENDNNADAILDKAIATTRKYGVKVWIIDNLMTINIGASDENIYQKQKDFIVKLNRYAMLYNVLIVLVTHPRKLMRGADLTTDDIAGSGDLGNLAQYILSVRRFTEDEKQGETDRNGNYLKGKDPIEEDTEVRIMKNRYTGKIGRARMYFDYPSYRFYGDPSEYYFRYSWNKDDSPYPRRDPRRDRTPTPFDD